MGISILRKYICGHCRKEFDVKDMRFTPDAKTLVCIGCFDAARNKIRAEAAEHKKAIAPTGPVNLDPHKQDRIRILCASCSYRFEMKKNTTARFRCPYCGKERLLVDDTTPERLLGQAEA